MGGSWKGPAAVSTALSGSVGGQRRGVLGDRLAGQVLRVGRNRHRPRHLRTISLHNLGVVHARLDRYEEALTHQQESLHLFKKPGNRTGEAECLNELGIVYHLQERYDLALAREEESLTIRRELGDRLGQAESLWELGVTLHALGRDQPG
jgi:tetratricopeptide (TPR) repeat protein